MKSLFDVRIEDQHRLFAYLKISETATAPKIYPPAYDPETQGGSSSILRIYTYAIDICRLTFGVSFVIRQYATFMDLPVLKVQASNSDNSLITIIPDCGSSLTNTPLPKDPRLYKLAIIGRGERHEQTGQGYYSNWICLMSMLYCCSRRKESTLRGWVCQPSLYDGQRIQKNKGVSLRNPVFWEADKVSLGTEHQLPDCRRNTVRG
jgi:hypothetical protein